MRKGEIKRIIGSVIVATGIKDVRMGEMMEVGKEGLIGEVIRLHEDLFTIQVYEQTSGIKPGEEVIGTGHRLVAELGPGLLTNVLDGIGRPLESILKVSGPFLSRGLKINMLDRQKKWHFKPTLAIGDSVGEGDVLGEVEETRMLTLKIMTPPGMRGRVTDIFEGDFTVEDSPIMLQNDGKKIEVSLKQDWPIRTPRPSTRRLAISQPLITGQRVIDAIFPIAKGGAACIPGGFGTGKTVVLQQLARWSDADVIVYIGCGERGNEICDVVRDFPTLMDPKLGLPLMERTIIIANTSNMPVAAREASIYLGITIGEYYRDMGLNVALLADSTSRWAEALREISSRLEEMPSEKGYPAYLPDRIAEFYERAGMVETIGTPRREGSVTVIGAVSPPGGDFNEPVTIDTLRFTGVFWALDEELAYRRHFPAINWLKSYSLYVPELKEGWARAYNEQIDRLSKLWGGELPSFVQLRGLALKLLSESAEVESIARIIGESALPDEQRLILLISGMITEGFLRQSAYGIDSYYSPPNQILLLNLILSFYQNAEALIKKQVPMREIVDLPAISQIKRIKEFEKAEEEILKLKKEAEEQLAAIGKRYAIEEK